MPVKSSHAIIGISRRAIAIALALWCAGAGCMIVSYAHDASMSGPGNPAPHSSGHSLSSAASASMGTHACCKARHSSRQSAKSQSESSPDVEQIALPESPAPYGVMSCCPLTSGSILVASRSQSYNDNAFVSAQADSRALEVTNSQPAPLAIPLRLPNQNQTYLRVCVFLI